MRLVIGLSVALVCSPLLNPMAQAEESARADESAQLPPKHTVFGEFFGAGLGIMLNYERRLYPWLGLRGGAGYSFSTGIGSGEFVNAVISASGLYQLSGAHHLELSPGLGLLKEIGGDRSASAISLLGGYRYQSGGGGLFARIQLGPAVFTRSDRDAKTIPLFGIAAGWSF